jgi:hypothetical protein
LQHPFLPAIPAPVGDQPLSIHHYYYLYIYLFIYIYLPVFFFSLFLFYKRTYLLSPDSGDGETSPATRTHKPLANPQPFMQTA